MAEKQNAQQSGSNRHRTLLIPYMGDFSCAAAAAFRYFGISAQVLPTNREKAYEFAGKYIHTESCFPMKGVVGDTLSFLDDEVQRIGKQEVEKGYGVAFPTTSGPCRFGKYHEVLRQFMDDEGLEGVPVMGPTSETDYTDILGDEFSLKDELAFYRLSMKTVVATDLLDDLVLRFRPYANDPEEVNRCNDQQLNELIEIVERGADMEELRNWAQRTLQVFQKFDGQRRYPLVLFAGEIYMRKHDPYNNYVVQKLEKKGLEAVRTPIIEWVEYVNKVNTRKVVQGIKRAVRRFRLNPLFRNLGRYLLFRWNHRYLCHLNKKIAGPAHHALADRHVLPDPETLIQELEDIGEFNGEVTGESPLSIGLAHYLMNDKVQFTNGANIVGMFHIGPFTCMQEGVATAKIESLADQRRREHPDTVFPVLHGFFGDSPNPNLDAEIGVFAEQCYQKQGLT